jgi:hypothetical protein
MVEYKQFTDLSKSEQRSYYRIEETGVEFEVSSNCYLWTDKQPRVPFWANDYYRVKGETSMTDDMTPFGKLDPVKQGEILVAFRNGDPNLQQWFRASEAWGDLKGIRQIFNDVVYRFKASPRECYVGFDDNGFSVKTSSYHFWGAVLMREVMED